MDAGRAVSSFLFAVTRLEGGDAPQGGDTEHFRTTSLFLFFDNNKDVLETTEQQGLTRRCGIYQSTILFHPLRMPAWRVGYYARFASPLLPDVILERLSKTEMCGVGKHIDCISTGGQGTFPAVWELYCGLGPWLR